MQRKIDAGTAEVKGYEQYQLSNLMKLQRGYFRERADPLVGNMNKHWSNATIFEDQGNIPDAVHSYEKALAYAQELKDAVEILVGEESEDWLELEKRVAHFNTMIMMHRGNMELHELEAMALRQEAQDREAGNA